MKRDAEHPVAAQCANELVKWIPGAEIIKAQGSSWVVWDKKSWSKRDGYICRSVVWLRYPYVPGILRAHIEHYSFRLLRTLNMVRPPPDALGWELSTCDDEAFDWLPWIYKLIQTRQTPPHRDLPERCTRYAWTPRASEVAETHYFESENLRSQRHVV